MTAEWLHQDGPRGDIALSSRVRLARNIMNIPFPGCDRNGEQKWVQEVAAALGDAGGGAAFKKTPLDSALMRQSLVEQHAISPDFAKLDRPRALMRTADGGISVMIGEEDHIRIQAFAPGLNIGACLSEAGRVDDLLDGSFHYAFSEELGYLTACPTNLGAGLRASVMLHLPALTRTGALRNIIQTVGQMGLTVRGLYGEGSQAMGDLYQLSNQGSMGMSENELAERITEAARQIIASERATRELVRNQLGTRYTDMIWRAFGLLTYARLVPLDEAMEQLGRVRVGVALGEITHVPMASLNRLLVEIQPATIMLEHGVSKEACDEKRADIIRKVLGSEDTCSIHQD